MRNKRLLPLFFLALYFPLSWAGAEENVTISKKYIENLEKRITALEEEKLQVSPQRLSVLTDDMKDMLETMEIVEKKTLMDRMFWGAELRNRVNWFRYQDRVAGTDLHTDELYQVRLRLNLYADLTDNLKFSGRLTGYWNWGDVTGQSQSSSWGPYNKASIPTDTTVRIERAYMDYFFDSIPFCLTIGRQPSAGGPPGELRENRVRKSI